MAALNSDLPITIGTRSYLGDLRGFGWAPTESQRQLQDSSREPSDATLANPAIWKRTATDFILGQGQNYLDQEDESDRRRFRRSIGIDIWDRRQITLLNDTSLGATTARGTICDTVVTSGHAYFASGTNIHRWNGTTMTACTGEAGTITSLAVVGGYVYAAGTAALRRTTVGGTAFSTFGSSTPDVIGTAGGRLVGGDGADLFEINADNSTTAIYTHFEGSGFDWRKIVGAPNGIYCFGDDGSRSVGYLLTVVDATGELAAPYPVLQMPDGEFIRDALFFGGVMVLATNLGVRLATINGSGFLTAGPLIEIGDVQGLGTDGFDIWFGWNNMSGSSAGIGRMRPSRFTDTLVPAYATDLLSSYSGDTRAVVSFQGKRAFIVDDGGSGRIVVESSNKVASGTLYTGIISYATPEDKGIHSIEGSWDALPAGARVRMQLAETFDGTPVAGGVDNSTTNSVNERGELTNVLRTEEAEVVITLNRATDATQAPVVRRWTLRSIIMPFRSTFITLALDLRSKVEYTMAGGHMRELAQNPLQEFQYLNGLMEDRTIVDVTVGDITRQYLVDYVGVGPEVQGVGVQSWTTSRDWLEGVWAVRLLSVEPTTS